MKRARPDLLVIDGASGEGGGQILRSSISLSAVSCRPVRIHSIRAGRPKPGLQRQHLVALEAAASLSGGTLIGASLGALDVTFTPPLPPFPPLRPSYVFDVGSAGSTTLVLQTLLPIILARLPRGSTRTCALTITGGTHNPMAPSASFLEAVLAPALRSAGAHLRVSCERHGFYPAGGGVLRAEVTALQASSSSSSSGGGGGGGGDAAPPSSPAASDPAALLRGGKPSGYDCSIITTAALPRGVAAREAAALSAALQVPLSSIAQLQPAASGPGNAVVIKLLREGGAQCELVCVCGERGVSSEAVVATAVAQVKELEASTAPFSEHAADQLLLPLLVMGGGRFRASSLHKHSKHFATNAEVLSAFCGAECVSTEKAEGGEAEGWCVTVRNIGGLVVTGEGGEEDEGEARASAATAEAATAEGGGQ